ncbi:hypothetical protein DH2020_015301 [Rehmannia glutinosa]|uniref:GRAM domain-containing protein n=1 Tax=Rehmannia glutinosa TaxID=99300 RepID=A0ABR0WTA3_REHGL
MMGQPTNNSTEYNNAAEENKPASPGKDPIPIRKPNPDPNPNPVDGALKPGNNGDIGKNDTTINVYLNGSNSSSEESSIKSPAGGLKPKKSVRWSQELVSESPAPRDYDHGSSNPYVNYSPAPSPNSTSFYLKDKMGSMKDVLGRWGKKVGEATRKAEDLAGNTWQHLHPGRGRVMGIAAYLISSMGVLATRPLSDFQERLILSGKSSVLMKTSPSLTDAALGRIAHGTKVFAEGGYEKIFRQTFETVPEEQLKYSYACYLSTSAGPVMGVLYVSTAKLAFSSDNPLPYEAGDKTDWSYYKVVIPLHQLKAVNTSTSRTNSAEKYIQIINITRNSKHKIYLHSKWTRA